MSLDIPKAWTFKNESVAKHFNEHVEEQLPWYELASRLIAFYAKAYLYERSTIYDLGCSTGNIAKRLQSFIVEKHIYYKGFDSSREILKENSAGLPTYNVDINDIKFESPDVIVSMLTMLFIPKRKRKMLFQAIYDSLPSGGAFILLERFTQPDFLSLTSARLILSEKKDSGDNILKKELSLVGSQFLLSKSELPGEPHNIFTFADFIGYLIEKP
jgi:tRNA (cmo5U34)-methyltransferase